MTWAATERYLREVQLVGPLRGDTVEVDGAPEA